MSLMFWHKWKERRNQLRLDEEQERIELFNYCNEKARELSPCPFCGSPAQIGTSDSGYGYKEFFATCVSHYCGIGTDCELEADWAIEKWNKRAECKKDNARIDIEAVK